MSMSNERMDRGSIGTVHALCEEAKPLMHIAFCPEKPILAIFNYPRNEEGRKRCLEKPWFLLSIYQRFKR
jgi:hypothetical protein